MNSVAMTDSMFARSGVPSLWWNAEVREERAVRRDREHPVADIIHEAPEFMSVKMKRIAVMPKRTSAAPP